MRNKPDNKSLRNFSLIALFVGAGGSIIFTLFTGRNNPSVLLPILFSGWVVSPYIVLLLIHFNSLIHLKISNVSLFNMTLFITFINLIGYSGVLSPKGMKPAFVFLVIPFVSWLIIGIISLILKMKKPTD